MTCFSLEVTVSGGVVLDCITFRGEKYKYKYIILEINIQLN